MTDRDMSRDRDPIADPRRQPGGATTDAAPDDGAAGRPDRTDPTTLQGPGSAPIVAGVAGSVGQAAGTLAEGIRGAGYVEAETPDEDAESERTREGRDDARDLPVGLDR